ncbi:MAG: LPS-assembly protein [Candidatus Endobugula sp.]|jgi:LPS-assembly protein
MIFTLLCNQLTPSRPLIRTTSLLIGIGFSASPLADIKQTLDWVPLSQLTEEQRQELPLGSCGAYISPLAEQDTSLDIIDSATETSSAQSIITEKNGFKEITLIGDVIVKKGYQKLTADQAIYSEQTGNITINGQLTIRQPDLLLIADKGEVNQRKDTLAIDNATYVIHSAHIRGQAKSLKKNQQKITLTNSQYTHCEPGSNDWYLKGSTITIDTEKNQGSATNVRLIVKGIPVFYWPYLRFPIGDERQSGFLYPTLSLSDGAIDLSIPYYFNFAPNYDLILTPHLLHNHGTMLEVNGRHLNNHFETEVNLTHLNDDSGKLKESEESLLNDGTKTRAEINPFAGNERWQVSINQQGGKQRQWFSSIDYNEVSDNDYLKDFDASTLNSNSEVSLLQQIKAGYQFTHWRFEVNTQQYQTLDDSITRPYKQLPQMTFDGEYNIGEWDINLENEWILFDHSDADDPGDKTLVGGRSRLRYAIGKDNDWDAGFFHPRLQTQYLAYQLEDDKLNTGANNTPSIIVPQLAVDSGLYFERSGNGYQQTFEPRLFYFYSEHKNQSDLTRTGEDINFDTSDLTFSYNQLFNDTRFSGGDRIDDANQLSIGLTTRFIGNETGREIFSASIGKALYFEERKVTLSGTPDTANNSPIAGIISSNFAKNWTLTNDIIYDDDANEIADNTISIKYRGDNSSLFNLSHRFLRNSSEQSEQSELSFIKPLFNGNWTLIGHSSYDYQNNQELERLLGIEYHSCCYRVRFAYERVVDDDQFTSGTNNLTYDEGIILEFQFFGLGGTGKQFDKLLEDSIDGYEQWQATYRE